VDYLAALKHSSCISGYTTAMQALQALRKPGFE
jgi:hypothetical protein